MRSSSVSFLVIYFILKLIIRAITFPASIFYPHVVEALFDESLVDIFFKGAVADLRIFCVFRGDGNNTRLRGVKDKNLRGIGA